MSGSRIFGACATGCSGTASDRREGQKGNTYETFRITEMEALKDGHLTVYEIDLHEFQGYILPPGNPPSTLTDLQRHLEGRAARLGSQLSKRIERLERLDKQLDAFEKLPNAHVFFSYKEVMAGRVVE